MESEIADHLASLAYSQPVSLNFSKVYLRRNLVHTHIFFIFNITLKVQV